MVSPDVATAEPFDPIALMHHYVFGNNHNFKRPLLLSVVSDESASQEPEINIDL